MDSASAARAAALRGELVCGSETLSDEELARNRCDLGNEILAHSLDDDYHKARSPVWSKVTVPFLSAGNWGGQGITLARQRRGFCPRSIKAEVAGAARAGALDALLHRLWAPAAEAILRLFSERHRQRLGRRTAGSAADSDALMDLSSARKTSGPSAARAGRGSI